MLVASAVATGTPVVLMSPLTDAHSPYFMSL